MEVATLSVCCDEWRANSAEDAQLFNPSIDVACLLVTMDRLEMQGDAFDEARRSAFVCCPSARVNESIP